MLEVLFQTLDFVYLQGRSLSFKSFFLWVLISIYQGKEEMFGFEVLNLLLPSSASYTGNISYKYM